MQYKNLCPTVKHDDDGVLVWSCLSTADVGNLKFIDLDLLNMDQLSYMDHIYLNIIKDNIYSSAQKLNFRESFILQQDNNSKHIARKING